MEAIPNSDEDGYSSADTSLTHHTDELPDDDLRPCIRSLGMTKEYPRNWDTRDAFREFYQNWRDAIVASFGVNPRSFAPKWTETGTRVEVTVHRESPSGKELLGYIKFDERTGSFELANFDARLEMSNLHLGGTSKRGTATTRSSPASTARASKLAP